MEDKVVGHNFESGPSRLSKPNLVIFWKMTANVSKGKLNKCILEASVVVTMSLNFYCICCTMCSSTYLPGFSVQIFVQLIYTSYAN
jgi:hypothetical protein